MRKERPEFADIYPAGKHICSQCGTENLAGERFHYHIVEEHVCPDCHKKIEDSYAEIRKRAYISGEEEPDYTDEITCPWCGEEYLDSWEFENDEDELECDCGKSFSYTRNVEVTYSTSRE